MLLIIVMATIVAVGLIAIALAHPRRAEELVVWNDATERRLLNERTVRLGWW
ncbi:MAG TPA: hypothetical protein VHS78_03185 [Candidatus Elarobacter sp.]|jgi:hypothetical protein|nr:hypothetical protein [Candidatus Elarobacter sp.]